MSTRKTLLQETEALLRLIEREWQVDLGSSVCWFGAEGERVRDHALEFLEALRAGTEQNLLHGRSLAGYLGRDWVDSHATVSQQVFIVAGILSEVT